jgi:phosphoesterase RecJ-like protein
MDHGMTEQLNVQQMAQRLMTADNILILCHKNPDGDTIGCGSALYCALKALDKNVAVLCSDAIPNRYAFTNAHMFKGEFEPQTVVAVDVASVQLFGENNGMTQFSRHVDLCIDHHAGNSGYADFTLLNGSAAAAAELLYEVINAMGVAITPHIADCLYTGLATDTGCFRFSSTTANTHIVAAKLIEAGCHVEELNTLLFDTKPRERMEAERIARNHLEYYLDGRCALIYLTRDEIEQSGVDPADLEELTSLPVSIEGVKVGLTLRQQPVSVCAPQRAWTPAPSPGVWAEAVTAALQAVSCWAIWKTQKMQFWQRWKPSWTHRRRKHKCRAS